jgi:hypothetical protein
MTSRRAQCAVFLLPIVLAAAAAAQVFRIQGGESTLLNAQGGSVEFKAPNYDGSIGLGFYNGRFELGGETRYLFHGYTMLAGDESVPFLLPTDVFDGSHYFSARGVGITRSNELGRFYAFAGATSTLFGTSFFNAATADRPAAIFFGERKLNPQLKFFTREIVSSRQTALQGLEWKARPWLKTGITAGIGSNQMYFASSADAETDNLALKASYVVAGDKFRRVTVLSPLSSEVTKGNIQMLYKPTSFMSITTGHENILEPLTAGGAMQEASVNQFSADFHVSHFYFGTGLFASAASGRHTQGTNLYGGRRIGHRLEVNANWFESRPQNGEKTTLVSGTVRENISSRLSLLQLVSRTQGQTTFSFGGDFLSNRLMLHASYQNVYLPFRPDRPFEQALALNAVYRVAGPFQVSVATDVAPDGHLRYSFGASTYLYRVRGLMMSAQSAGSFSIAKYVVQGTVKDEQGAAVEGAALHVGRELAYTDSSGHFLVRFSRHGPYPLKVAPEEFLTAIAYDVLSAPGEVRADSEDSATEIQISVRSIPRARPTPVPAPMH